GRHLRPRGHARPGGLLEGAARHLRGALGSGSRAAGPAVGGRRRRGQQLLRRPRPRGGRAADRSLRRLARPDPGAAGRGVGPDQGADLSETLRCDVLILGSGGAGLLAALHALRREPRLRLVLASKGLVGKSGCTRMVQGGYNAVLDPKDSLQAHFEDTVRGGAFLNDQELAWTLVEDSPRIVLELENRIGCLFDRAPDGRIRQKAFA